MPLPLGLLLGLGLGVEGYRHFDRKQQEAQAVQDRQLAIQDFISQVLPENQPLVGAALNAAQNPDAIINDVIKRRTAQADPISGTLTTVLDPNDPTALLRQLINPQTGDVMRTLGNAPPPAALVNINTGGELRDLPAGQAVELGQAQGNVINSQNLKAAYKPEFSNMGIDMLGGLGASAEQFLDKISGDNTDRTRFWNNIESDKVKFVKQAFGGNASDRDRATIDAIYPNPRFDDATNQALLENLEQEKLRIFSSMQQGLQGAGFGGVGTPGINPNPDVDFDLTR